ncbi:hypothetical protein HID58_058108 [Brassica napus]|uniref:Glutaminyl-tRNA synthetase class Ib non-specific RNA-binding domain-containing protein n=1 Tax=Brassica napus TaxID=3708 RepID=A0ABQ7ZP40_BRANA|nr:hypothetical protein HID58_058108 [Brassica napus]
MAPNDDESVKLFLSIGLDEKTATTTINNPKVTANLTAVIHEVSFLVSPPPSSPLSPSAGVTNGCDRTTGNLLYTDFKLNEFEEACGVGVEVSAEDIEKAADEVFEENKKTIVEQRYRTNGYGSIAWTVWKSLPWADPKIVKVS